MQTARLDFRDSATVIHVSDTSTKKTEAETSLSLLATKQPVQNGLCPRAHNRNSSTKPRQVIQSTLSYERKRRNNATMSTTATNNKNKNANTVSFNVGGHIHEVPRSLVETYPDTMLAALVKDAWQQNSNDDTPLFIDRDGARFGFVLDLMRDHQVHLPITVSKTALLVDLDYFGLEVSGGAEEVNGAEDAETLADVTNDQGATRGVAGIPQLVIHQGSVPGALKIMGAIEEHADDEFKKLEDAEKLLKDELERISHKKSAVKIAMLLLKRTINSKDWEITTKPGRNTRAKTRTVTTERLAVRFGCSIENMQTTAFQEYQDALNATKVEDFFQERLGDLGLTLVNQRAKAWEHCTITLERNAD